MLAKFRNLAFSLGILLLILACSSPAPTATPDLPPAPTALPAQGPVASVAPTPVPTPEPALTATPAPTEAAPSPAAEQPTAAPQPVTEPATATPVPRPTATTAPLPTPTPTPAPPPTATPPPPPTPTPTPAEMDDRAILTAFYHAMDGPNWADNTNWLTDAPLHEWFGVQVVRYGSSVVQGLNLRANRLKGEIPPELGYLEGLGNLDLSRNLLIGCIPLTLVYHEYFNLERSEFGGLMKCENPDRAALVSFYQATGGPAWVNSQNWLTYRPIGEWYGVEVNERGRVTSLIFRSNGLDGEIPAVLGDLAELRKLSIDTTSWRSELEREGVDLTAAQHLRGAIPPELGNLGNLLELNLVDNRLTGEIPPELGNLGKLRELRLHGNRLTGEIPPELGNLGKLRELRLYENQLTGAIPPELGNLVNLWYLNLSKNQLTGAIPPELGNLGTLRGLSLAHNQLTGVIPPELGNLGNLIEGRSGLYLSHNQLTGVIPIELGNLSSLDLADNQLTGVIPIELVSQGNLSNLNLANNQLTGTIPPELVYLEGDVSIWGNQFSGCVARPLEQIRIYPGQFGLEWCQ